MEKAAGVLDFDKIVEAMYVALYPWSTNAKNLTKKEALACLEQQVFLLKRMTAPSDEMTLSLEIRHFLRESGDEYNLNSLLLEQFLKSFGDHNQTRLLKYLQ